MHIPVVKTESDRKRKKTSISSSDRTEKSKKKSKMSSEKVRASHILIKHQGSRRKASWKDPEGRVIASTTRDSAVSQLKALRDDIVSGIAKFADVAARYSDCSSAKRGGDLELDNFLARGYHCFYPLCCSFLSLFCCILVPKNQTTSPMIPSHKEGESMLEEVLREILHEKIVVTSLFADPGSLTILMRNSWVGERSLLAVVLSILQVGVSYEKMVRAVFLGWLCLLFVLILFEVGLRINIII